MSVAIRRESNNVHVISQSSVQNTFWLFTDLSIMHGNCVNPTYFRCPFWFLPLFTLCAQILFSFQLKLQRVESCRMGGYVWVDCLHSTKKKPMFCQTFRQRLLSLSRNVLVLSNYTYITVVKAIIWFVNVKFVLIRPWSCLEETLV